MLVRARLRNAARRGVTRQTFLEDEISAALVLADYVVEHSDNLVRRSTPVHQDVSPAPSSGHLSRPISALIRAKAQADPPPRLSKKEVPVAVHIACSDPG